MRRPAEILALTLLAATAGCAMQRAAPAPGMRVLKLGEQCDTPYGKFFALRIQDEYRVIRCIPDGPIAGCYEDVLSVPRGGLSYNRWMDVKGTTGLQVAIISPQEVAFRIQQESGTPR